MSALTKVYEKIAMTRRHVCSNCSTTQWLSHSHLVPKSQAKELETLEENIVYHCLSIGKIGCHDIWENHKPNAVFMKDFVPNMKVIYRLSPTYYWQVYHKISGYWNNLDIPGNHKIFVFAKAIENGKNVALKTLYDLNKQVENPEKIEN